MLNGRHSRFNHSICPVKLVQACLCARKDLVNGLSHCGGPARLVQACLFARKALESSFHHCGSPIICQERSRIFSPLLRSYEARGSLFMCVKGLESGFHHTIGPVKLVQSCLSVRKCLESNFHQPSTRSTLPCVR